MKFAGRLVELRATLPLRNAKIVMLQEVAKEAGVNLGSYSKAENGIIPGEKVLIRIARYFNVSEAFLLKGATEEVEVARPIYKGIDEEDSRRESWDKAGLFGKTRRIRVAGTEIAVTTHEPSDMAAEGLACAQVLEILRSGDPVLVSAIQANLRAFHMAIGKDRQLSEQTAKIENLEVECEDLKKRISALEAKLLENDPNEVPGQDPGERKAASSL